MNIINLIILKYLICIIIIAEIMLIMDYEILATVSAHYSPLHRCSRPHSFLSTTKPQVDEREREGLVGRCSQTRHQADTLHSFSSPNFSSSSPHSPSSSSSSSLIRTLKTFSPLSRLLIGSPAIIW
ncbi:hypothetical protein Dimus_015159 [Dionaea muscipula]